MTTGQCSQGGLPEEVKSEQGQAPRPRPPNLGRGRKTNLCFRALTFFALVAKKKKTLLRKTLYFLLVPGSIKVLGVKLLSCNTNCHRDRLGLLNLSPRAPVASPSPHMRAESLS